MHYEESAGFSCPLALLRLRNFLVKCLLQSVNLFVAMACSSMSTFSPAAGSVRELVRYAFAIYSQQTQMLMMVILLLSVNVGRCPAKTK